MTKKIIIPYFPVGLKYSTPIIFGIGIYLIVNNYFIFGSVFILFAIVVLTTYYVTEISMEHKRYADYISLVGIKLGMESTTFNKLDRIVITKGSHAQRVNSRLQSKTMQWDDYTATLLFDSQKTLDLITEIDKAKLVLGIREFAAFLEVPIDDRTAVESRRIR